MREKEELARDLLDDGGSFSMVLEDVKFWTFTHSHAHREKAESVLSRMYTTEKWEAPKQFYWFGHPKEMVLCEFFIQSLTQSHDPQTLRTWDLAQVTQALNSYLRLRGVVDIVSEGAKTIAEATRGVIQRGWAMQVKPSFGPVSKGDSFFSEIVVKPLRKFLPRVREAVDILDAKLFLIAADRLYRESGDLYASKLYNDLNAVVRGRGVNSMQMVADKGAEDDLDQFSANVLDRLYYEYLEGFTSDFGMGHQDLHWVMCYLFLADRVGITPPKVLEDLEALGRSAGWYTPFPDFVFISERFRHEV